MTIPHLLRFYSNPRCGENHSQVSEALPSHSLSLPPLTALSASAAAAEQAVARPPLLCLASVETHVGCCRRHLGQSCAYSAAAALWLACCCFTWAGHTPNDSAAHAFLPTATIRLLHAPRPLLTMLFLLLLTMLDLACLCRAGEGAAAACGGPAATPHRLGCDRGPVGQSTQRDEGRHGLHLLWQGVFCAVTGVPVASAHDCPAFLSPLEGSTFCSKGVQFAVLGAPVCMTGQPHS